MPRWPQDAHKLLYATDDQRIMEVTYTIQRTSFTVSKPRVWSEGRLGNTGVFPNFDVARKGDRIAAMLPSVNYDEGERNQATFLLNFSDEVRRRVASQGK